MLRVLSFLLVVIVNSCTLAAQVTDSKVAADSIKQLRKFGPFDYKQQSSKYRDFTLFNLGAAGAAAGIPQDELISLSRSSKPTQDEVSELDQPALSENFVRDATELERLRAMVQVDSKLTRIAPDFTWLNNNTKWPREDVGISEGRWNDYRSLFTRLSLSEGVLKSEDFPEAVFFIVTAKGLCTGGTSSGYVYSTRKLNVATKSIDATLREESRKDPAKHYAYAFRALKGNWYSFYEVDW